EDHTPANHELPVRAGGAKGLWNWWRVRGDMKPFKGTPFPFDSNTPSPLSSSTPSSEDDSQKEGLFPDGPSYQFRHPPSHRDEVLKGKDVPDLFLVGGIRRFLGIGLKFHLLYSPGKLQYVLFVGKVVHLYQVRFCLQFPLVKLQFLLQFLDFLSV